MKTSWALVVVLVGVALGYFGRAIVTKFTSPRQTAADYSVPLSWPAYRFAQWADGVLTYLKGKLVPPPYRALQLATAHFTSQALHLAAKLGVADIIGDDSKTAAELATTIDVNEEALYRILRTLASLGYFVETEPRRFSNSELSAVLRKDHPSSVRNLVMAYHDHIHWSGSDGMLLSLTENLPGWRKFLPDESFWDYYEDNRVQNEVFNQAMAETNALRGAAIIEDYDFKPFKHVVDVGAGRGNFVHLLLRKHSHLKATIYDQKHIIEEDIPEWKIKYGRDITNYQERVHMEAGDFFQRVPSGGDCYVLKGILSQLDDEEAATVLRNVHKAMEETHDITDGQKLVLIEADFIQPHDQRQLNLALDLVAMTVYHGKGRTREEFEQLLRSAGFTLQRVVETRSPYTVLEATPVSS